MNNLKICFIGLGSIAGRHIQNIGLIFREWGKEPPVIDVLRSSAASKIPEGLQGLINRVYFSYGELPDDYDVIFITNPTVLHYEALSRAHAKGKHFFIEKPVFATGKEDTEALNLRKDSVYYVACPLRYCKVIRYLKENMDFSGVYSIRCISSSYLPQWRPGLDYRNTYSAKKEMGGGVSIDLIHEWDYICSLIGLPDKVCSIQNQVSDLEIDADDIAVYIAQYPGLVLELHLDYFGRHAMRRIELYSKHDTVIGDIISGQIHFLKTGKVLDLKDDRNQYQKEELKHFFRLVSEQGESDNDIGLACKILRLARGE